MKPQNTVCSVLVCCATVAAVQTARCQIAYGGNALSYTQNFDSIGTNSVTWTDNGTVAGWYLNSATLGVPATVGTSFGNNSGGGAFNVGVEGIHPVTDRALGWLNASTTGTAYIGVQVQNTSGLDYVGDVSLTLTYEQSSARTASSDPLEVDYKANLASSGNQLTSPGWTILGSIASPNLSNTGNGTTHYIDGNAPGNFTTVTETATFTSAAPWLAGTFLWFRTKDSDISSNDDLNAIDDVTINVAAQPVPEPSCWALLATGLAGLALARRRTN